MPDRAVPPYTIISFAPIQSFIEQSRKLRDLYGSSLILSYLTYALLEQICQTPSLGSSAILSPGLLQAPDPISRLPLEEQEGLTNRIVLRGELDRNQAKHWLTQAWATLLDRCRHWLETEAIPPQNLPADLTYHWGYHWDRWKYNAWELFWGQGETLQAADTDFQRRKLRRDWMGINWMGDSSSLSGTDAVAWPQLGRSFSDQSSENSTDTQQHPDSLPPTVRSWSTLDPDSLQTFYTHLSWVLDDFSTRRRSPCPSEADLAQIPPEEQGKFLSARERLSIPELVKRLVTLPELARDLRLQPLEQGFRDLYREPGYWTGWFMGDGDRVGHLLQTLTQRGSPEAVDSTLQRFTQTIRQAGLQFKSNQALFDLTPGRIIYSGGDDLFGLLYAPQPRRAERAPRPLSSLQAYQWLLGLPHCWEPLQHQLQQDFGQTLTYSLGFVWVGHQVPQRDVLHHCRDAEQAAKRAGRDRVAIRVVFNNGQWLQWICPWRFLGVFMQYRDLDGKGWGEQPNWVHLYQDWADLKARHALRPKLPKTDPHGRSVDLTLALALFDLYFEATLPPDAPSNLVPVTLQTLEPSSDGVMNSEAEPQSADILDWLDDLINVGWQLCSNA